MQRGKLVILAIVSLALLLAGYAWWHRFSEARRPLALWGAENAVLIHEAPHVELLTLVEDEGDGESDSLVIVGRRLRVAKREDVSRAPGLLNARHALVQDASFDWNNKVAACDNWRYVLRFSDQSNAIHLAFDPDCGRMYFVENQVDVMLVDRIRKALAKYLGGLERPENAQ